MTFYDIVITKLSDHIYFYVIHNNRGKTMANYP